MTDFDPLAERFAQRIHGSAKGRLRTGLLWRHLCATVPAVAEGGWDCLDAGGGIGQMSERLAAAGHRVLLADPSCAMLERARTRLGETSTVELRQADLQGLVGQCDADLVLCHAVLEWLPRPREGLDALWQLTRPGGVLDLAVYNRNAVILLNMIKGNYRKLISGRLAGDPGGLTPPSPLDPDEIRAWVADMGWEILSQRGVRIASDILNPALRGERTEADTLEIEWRFGGQPPFRDMGRYLHLILRRPPV